MLMVPEIFISWILTTLTLRFGGTVVPNIAIKMKLLR
uniref:Uncharacterized protein n=1 Tax=Timema tahoe TaxID=61484 RepID=A0A7R9P1N8_9NEOP|nr:unnamed protein product [Timema tahoe]